MAGNVTSDASRFAVYTVPWYNANPTVMNDRNYVDLCGDDFAGSSPASSYTLRSCTTTATNYSVQVMGLPDYVGAAHQVLDGTMLDLDVSADFLRDVTMAGVIVDYDVSVGDGYAEGDTILHSGYAEVVVGSDAIVGGGMIVAVDKGVAQELANLIGGDCKSKDGGVPDSVVVDGVSTHPCRRPHPGPLRSPALGSAHR